MNKSELLKTILVELKRVHQVAVDAAQRAYETATGEENEAENKYDTFGLEASYLAHGQSKRVAECEADVIAFEKLPIQKFTQDMPITLGALVCLQEEQAKMKYVFLSPVSGGLNIQFDKKDITLVTASSPLGKALNTCCSGDDVAVNTGNGQTVYEIIAVH